MGKTGVEFRFYKKKEYNQLTKEQKNELREYREKWDNGEDGSKKKKQKDDKSQKQMISVFWGSALTHHQPLQLYVER